MIKRGKSAFAAVVLVAMATPALAHHSFSLFDMSKIVTIKGTIKDFEWSAPHSWIDIMVPKTGGGQWQLWSMECGAPGLLAREGWKPDSLKPGDNVTISLHPLKDGRPGGACAEVILADGKRLGVGKNIYAVQQNVNKKGPEKPE